MGALLWRGMLVGVLAGLAAFCFARIVGEPFVDRAISFESHHEHAASAHGAAEAAPGHQHTAAAEPEEELVSRATQAGLGLFTGIVVYAAAIGGVFAVAFALAYGRLGSVGPRGTSAVLALAGFTAFYLLPSLKYPSNPPSIGAPETIGIRTELYFVMVLISVVAFGLAAAFCRMSVGRLGLWNAAILSGAVFATVVGLWAAYLPGIDEVPDGFSPTLLWNFRLASMGIQAVLWTVLGLAFGPLARRVVQRPAVRAATLNPARSVLH